MIFHLGLYMRSKHFCLISHLQASKFMQKTQRPSLVDLSKIKVFFLLKKQSFLMCCCVCHLTFKARQILPELPVFCSLRIYPHIKLFFFDNTYHMLCSSPELNFSWAFFQFVSKAPNFIFHGNTISFSGILKVHLHCISSTDAVEHGDGNCPHLKPVGSQPLPNQKQSRYTR